MIEWLIGGAAMYYLTKKVQKCVCTSPLAKACWNGDFEMVKQMIKDGYDVNERDENRRTPLMCLMGTSNVGITRYLLEHGADISLVDDSGRNVWHYLIMNAASAKPTDGNPFREGYIRQAKLLSENGANKYINERDKEGKIPLIYLFNSLLTINPYTLTILMLSAGTNAQLSDFNGRNLISYIDNCNTLSNSDKGFWVKTQLVRFCQADLFEVKRELDSIKELWDEPNEDL